MVSKIKKGDRDRKEITEVYNVTSLHQQYQCRTVLRSLTEDQKNEMNENLH